MNYEKIYRKAIGTWGEDAQIMVAMEECSELIQAICKYYREPDIYMRREGIIDEIADVTIMCEQLSLIFGIEEVNNRIDFKINRLEKRLEN